MSPRPAQRALSASALGMLARALRAATRIIVVVFIARWYDEATVAHFSYAFVVGSFLGLLSDAGISEYLVREIGASGGKEGALRRAAIAFRGSTLPVALCLGFGLTHVRYSDAIVSLGGVGLALACSIADLFASIRRGAGRYGLECWESAPPVVAVMASIGLGALGFGARAFHLSLAILSWGFLATRLAAAAWSGRKQERAPLWQPAKGSRWFLAKTLVSWVLVEANVVLLEHLGDESSLAVFSVVARPVGFLSLPMAAVGMVFTPALARTYAVDRDRFSDEVLRLNLIHLAMLPGALGLCIFLGELVLAFTGMAESRAVLFVLASGYVAYMATFSGVPLIAMRRERLAAIFAAIGASLLVVSGFVLIPRYGALGAACASVVAFAGTKALYIGYYRRFGLPLGDRFHALIGAASAVYVASLAVLDGPVRYVVLVAGVLASLGMTARLMLATKLRLR